MIQTFTQDDVVRYVYEETTSEQNLLIEEGMIHDPEMLEFYLDVLDVKAGLEKSYREPSHRSIENILAYSRNTNSQHSYIF
jgi:hypothetical protein